MNLEQQVVSVEPAKQMEALGVPQKRKDKLTGVEEHTSYFVWVRDTDHYKVVNPTEWEDFGHENTVACAFTVAELGEMLPWLIKHNGKSYCQHYWTDTEKGWTYLEYVTPRNTDPQGMLRYVEHRKEADARAAMLIYLIENELLDPKTLSV